MTKAEKIAKMKADYEKALKTGAKEALEEILADFFTDNPTVTAVQWTQYYDEKTEKAIDPTGGEWFSYGGPPGLKEAVNAFWAALDEDLCEQAFGDGKKILATPAFTIVDDYDCGY